MSKCECAACQTVPHTSSCAVHNEPAMRAGVCTCGALLKEIEDLRTDLETYMRIANIEANANVPLRAALEPFSELADEGNADQPDDTPVTVYAGRTVAYHLTLKDLRRANKAFWESE